MVTNLYVLKCTAQNVPPLGRSVPRRLHLVYGALRAEFCVLLCVRFVHAALLAELFACGALRAELLRA